MDFLTILVLFGVPALGFGVFWWMRKQADEDREFQRQNPHATYAPAPLTFGSIVGAIVVGNIVTAIIGAIFWWMLFRVATS